MSLQAPGAKRSHPPGGARQYPHNAKKQRMAEAGRPFFAEITDDSGRRTRVPCRYDTSSRMYVPSGGRDTVPCGQKVGTRDKTPQDLQVGLEVPHIRNHRFVLYAPFSSAAFQLSLSYLITGTGARRDGRGQASRAPKADQHRLQD